MSSDLLYSWMVSVRKLFGMVSRMEGWGGVMDWESEYIFLFIPLFLYSLSFFAFFVFLHIRVFLLGSKCRNMLLFVFIAGEIILVSYSQTFAFESIVPLYIPVYTFCIGELNRGVQSCIFCNFGLCI